MSGLDDSLERRTFTRVQHAANVELHQGGAVWQVMLLEISLKGITVTEPADWDADYSHPFNFVLPVEGQEPLEAYAHLLHIQPGIMGFEIEHLSSGQLALLRQILALYLDEDTLTEEIARLQQPD